MCLPCFFAPNYEIARMGDYKNRPYAIRNDHQWHRISLTNPGVTTALPKS